MIFQYGYTSYSCITIWYEDYGAREREAVPGDRSAKGSKLNDES